MTLLDTAKRGYGAVRWYVRGVLGEDRYDKYLAHAASLHSDVPPMTEREFWRDYSDRQESNPQGRCC